MWVKGQIAYSLNDASGGLSNVLTRAAQPHLFDRITWYKLLWTHNRLGARPIIARAWGEGARSWLFLAQQNVHSATSLANYYTLAFRLVFTGNPDAVMRRALMVAIARRLRRLPLRLARVTLTPVPTDDGSAAELAAAFRAAGWWVFQSFVTANWTVNVAGKSFDAYWSERPGALRSTLARKLKKSLLTTEVHTRFDDALWEHYETIYAESWKPEEGSTAFLRALAEQEAEAGGLRFGLAWLDGVAVAAQLWTIEPGRAIIHKLAYRASAADHSPGTLLTAAMFQYVIDTDKVDVIDYGTGDDAYKADWMDTRSEMERIECFNPRSLRGFAKGLKTWAVRLVRRIGGA